MKSVAIIGWGLFVVIAAAVILQPSMFGLTKGEQKPAGAVAHKAFTACQNDRCMEIDNYVLNSGCLLETTEDAKISGQMICGEVFVTKN